MAFIGCKGLGIKRKPLEKYPWYHSEVPYSHNILYGVSYFGSSSSLSPCEKVYNETYEIIINIHIHLFTLVYKTVDCYMIGFETFNKPFQKLH